MTDITLTIGTTQALATLADTPTARNFARLLPLTLSLSDFHKTEKVADLPSRLTMDGAPAGASALAGDLTYYSPWGNLAIFYEPFGKSPGLVRLGKLTAGLDIIRGASDGTILTIELAAAGEIAP
jgi:hypothetical protein